MNFLNKARKKAEDTLKEIQAQAQAQGIGQSRPQNTNQYNHNAYPQQNPQQFSPPPQFNQQPPYSPSHPHGNPPQQFSANSQPHQQQYYSAPPSHGSEQSYPQQGNPAQLSGQHFSPPSLIHLQQHYSPPPSQGVEQPYHQQGYQAPQSGQYFSPPPNTSPGPPSPSISGQQYPPPPPEGTRDQPTQGMPQQYYQTLPTNLPNQHGTQAPVPAPHVTATPPSSQDGTIKCLAKESVLPPRVKFYCFIPSIGVSGESFTVCSNCFQSNVASYSLASNFMEFQTSNESLRLVCDFSIPRVRYTWYSHCVPQNNVQALADFSRFTESLTPCDGSIMSSPGPFWITKNQTIPDLAVCNTCFEYFIRLTPFEGKFEEITLPETRDWSCDLSLPSFRRELTAQLEMETPSFQDMAKEFNTRFNIPPCSGVGKAISTFDNDQGQSLIFTAVGGKTGNICFACYCNYLSNTSLEDEFVGAALTAEQKSTVTCDLASGYSKSAMEIAILQNDTEVWRNAVGMAGKVGVCFGRKGVTEEEWEKKVAEHGSLAQWWHVTNYPRIEICPSCYWLVVKLFKADSCFSPITRPLRAGIVRMCFLAVSIAPSDTSTENPDLFENSLTWRGRRLRNAISTGYELGNFSLLLSEAASISQLLPPCGGNDRGFKRVTGRKWYGRLSQHKGSNNDCTVVMCEECWSRAIRGSPLEREFRMDLTDAAYQNEGDTGFPCQPYSNRARKELRDATDLASFARYWNTREALRKKRDLWILKLHEQTMKMAMQNQQQSLNMMLKLNAQANALSMIGAAGVVEAAMSDPGERWGNSQIGYNSYTKGRAEAEQEFKNAQNMDIGGGASISSALDAQRIIQLGAIDEAAFKEYE